MRCLITKNSSRYALCNNSKKFYSKIVTLKSRKTNFPSCLPRLSGPLHDYSFAGSHTLHFLSFHLFQVFKSPFSSNIFFRVSLDMERVYDESCSAALSQGHFSTTSSAGPAKMELLSTCMTCQEKPEKTWASRHPG